MLQVRESEERIARLSRLAPSPDLLLAEPSNLPDIPALLFDLEFDHGLGDPWIRFVAGSCAFEKLIDLVRLLRRMQLQKSGNHSQRHAGLPLLIIDRHPGLPK